jgi:PPOX class probable F420-dependent enzyme
VPEIPASHRDIVANGQVVTLATIGPDGVPQVSALWYLLDTDGIVRVSLNTSRQKTKNLRARPDGTLLFMDPANPYRTVEMRARAEIAPDPEYAFADRVGAKYGANLREMDQPGEQRVVISFIPVKINTFGQG